MPNWAGPERTFPVWFWFALAGLAALLLIAAATGVLGDAFQNDSGSGSHISRQQYEEDLSYCKDRATIEVQASGGLYRVGGTHWVELVRDCQMARANDRP